MFSKLEFTLESAKDPIYVGAFVLAILVCAVVGVTLKVLDKKI
jgi:hypothetical protein